MVKKRTVSPLPDSKTEKRERQPEKKEPKSAAASNKAVDEHAKPFSVQMIRDMLVRKFTSGTVKKEAAVFSTAVLEYVSAEILELLVNVARNRSNHRDSRW
ncbi:hypothetical protein AVEN_108563-1 [Araneus ventricosus]|uniref:Histone H2A n=1 Tax=Araneus ventricosus TaxID=182803 RepID=A0A4Y2DGN8_ARAVE|nr:hypothetical protein AVEN_108563-1 [Araneus ventricosus]